MARKIVLAIICAVTVLLAASSMRYHEAPEAPEITAPPVYHMEYTRGVNILRRIG